MKSAGCPLDHTVRRGRAGPLQTSGEAAPEGKPANDKRFARVKVLRTINEAIEAAFAGD